MKKIGLHKPFQPWKNLIYLPFWLVFLFLCFSTGVRAQTVVVTGTVSDSGRESLPGVNIVVKGTNTGTISDINGNYRITVRPGDILVFSFIGYESQEVSPGTRTVVNVTLASSSEALEEVVIVGYGTQRKESVVGAISQTTGEELKKISLPDVTNSLTGLIPGLITIQTSGIPGGSGTESRATAMYIRGLSTWNAGGPLILIDGVERSMQDVDASEIENISVLKDASATAVFGVQGANGVILITTKRGRVAKPKINFEANTTVSQPSRVYTPLGSYDTYRLRNQAVLNELNISESAWAAFTPIEILNYYATQEYPDLFPDVNWLKELSSKFATAHQYNLNVSGGSEFVNYFGSLSYLHEGDFLRGEEAGQGYLPEFRFDRINFRSNLDFKLSKTTKLSANFSGSFGQRGEPNVGSRIFWTGVYGQPPDEFPIRYSDGIFGEDPSSRYVNPYKALNYGGQNQFNRSQLFADLAFDQKLDFITDGLSVSAKASFDNYFETQGPRSSGASVVTKYILPEYFEAPPGTDINSYTVWTYPGSGAEGYNFSGDQVIYNPEQISAGSYRRRLFYQFSVNYARSFGDHELSALALINRTESAAGSQFVNKRESWVSRFTYNYRARYFLEFNGAYNGSEKFDRAYRFGFFPSFAAGWLISNEPFFKETIPFVDIFKLRYSNGRVGSDAGVPRWLYVSDWIYNGLQWTFGEPTLQPSGYPIYLEGLVSNPTARWETAIKNNAGLETGWFENKLKLNIDYFWEFRKDMLISAAQRTTNVIFGANLPSANLGEVKTHGYEIELNYDFLRSKSNGAWAKGSFNYAFDKILSRDDAPLLPSHRKQEGHQIDQILEYRNTVIMQTWNDVYGSVAHLGFRETLPGDYGLVDYNADGVITADDIVPVGYPGRPQYNYTFSLGGNYGRLRASVMFYGVFNVSRSIDWNPFPQGYSLLYPIHLDAWTPDMGDPAIGQYRSIRFQTNSQYNARGSQRLWDASYLRLNNAEIAYDFDRNGWIRKMGLSGLNAYLRGNNLFLWNHIPEDREARAGSGGDAFGEAGSEIRAYPIMRRFTAGLTFNF